MGTVACACYVPRLALGAPRTRLDDLYFCEMCYELRCAECVAWEVSRCYCPHCLFEVPGTSVRAQRGRCARSCFECPLCAHVLSIIGSDPPRRDVLTAPEASMPVPPYYLSCTACRWDSLRLKLAADTPAELGRVHDAMDAHAESALAYEAAAEHLECVRAERAPPPLPPSPGGRHGQRVRREPALVRDDMRHVTRLSQRWAAPAEQPYHASALRPQRVRLLSQVSKRCAACRHLLVRPELRSGTGTVPIKMLAHQFLPSCHLEASEQGGPTLVLTNPLLEPMDVELRTDTELGATHAQLPPSSDAWTWADDAASAPPTFTTGARTYRNQAMISVRWHEETHLAMWISWRAGDVEATHSFYVCLSRDGAHR